jgi:hypothetical protein
MRCSILFSRTFIYHSAKPLANLDSFVNKEFQLLMSNIYTQEALINLLDAKGIIKKPELLEEIRRIRKQKAKGRA